MRRFYLIALLLISSLLLVGLLAWQAHYAVSSHRHTAESVLGDYADLASSEFVRRTLTEIGYYGYYPLIRATRAWAVENPGAALVAPADLPADEEQARALELASYLFTYDARTGALETSDPELPAALAAELGRRLEALVEDAPTDGSYASVFAEIEGEMHSFVYAAGDVGQTPPRRLLGFGVDLSLLGGWIERAVGRGPLLPPSLSDGELTNESIFLEVILGEDQLLYRLGEPYQPWFGVEKPFGDSYRGLLEEITVRLAIDPEVAPQLVIGGLPRSRLPLLLGILGLVVGLVLIAIMQLRRERALIRLRSDFVSRVSHELRTPLTQIRMFAETLLLKRVRSPEEGQRALEIIDRESRRLSHLVENVLQFSRSEHDAIQLAPEPRSLAPLLSELVDEFNPLLDEGGASVVTRLVDNPQVTVDEDAMRQIVLNLLENAVKYGPPRQEVQLGTTQRNGRVQVWVDDEGPGIRTADRERIWEPFQRVAPDPGSALTGTGIGLSVVRDLVARHGGTTWVEDGLRGGARFVVELPATGGEASG